MSSRRAALAAAGLLIAAWIGGARANPPAAAPPAPAAAAPGTGPLTSAQLAGLREKWNQPAEPFHILGPIYYVGTAGLAAYLIVTPKGHFLLDAGLEESAPLIEHNIEALGYRLTDIEYLLNSHAHYDHAGGLARLKQATSARLVASAGDRSALEGGFYLGSESDHTLDAPKVGVDRVIADGQSVSLGGMRLTAHLTPGHTRGCTSWSLRVREAGKPLDVLFYCSTTVAANHLVPEQYPGIVRDYERTFARLRRMKADVFLAPHPEFFHMQEKRARTNEASNPFVDPAELQAYVESSAADFHKQLAAQQAAAAAAGPAPIAR